MKIVVGADHGGYHLKEEIKKRLIEEGYEVVDAGVEEFRDVDYPDIAFKAAEMVGRGEVELGILMCGTGIGMCNAASKVPGVIAALCTNEYMARMSRLHNAANVLCMGGRVVGPELAWSIVKTWLENEPLYDEKRIRRRKKIEDYVPG
ncbi:MAG: ribose 5-phosphate isomerase B [Thermoplasmata archaeon]|nr:ribose 5-phosphate isomerase B [Thermoplasmata archaeon]